MTIKKRPPYRSGHCTAGVPGGHQRCRPQITETLTCACTCHNPPTTEDKAP